jgi:hypothetical protein
MLPGFDSNCVPWTRQERALLAECVEAGFDWTRCSEAVSRLGGVASSAHALEFRGARECEKEYGRMLASWSRQTRVLPTPLKLRQAALRQRARQLERRVERRQTLLSHMADCIARPDSHPDVKRFVEACMRDARTARIYGRGDSMDAWKEIYDDDDDGFGPFLGWPRKQPVQSIDLGVASSLLRVPVPFPTNLLFSPPPPPSLPPQSTVPAVLDQPPPATDSTFLLSVFEAIAGHRFAAPFQESDYLGIPEYVAIIKQPVCISDLRAQLHDRKIVSALQLLRMFELMISNAFVFNARGSTVYEAAEQLRAVVARELEPLLVIDLLARLHLP